VPLLCSVVTAYHQYAINSTTPVCNINPPTKSQTSVADGSAPPELDFDFESCHRPREPPLLQSPDTLPFGNSSDNLENRVQDSNTACPFYDKLLEQLIARSWPSRHNQTHSPKALGQGKHAGRQIILLWAYPTRAGMAFGNLVKDFTNRILETKVQCPHPQEYPSIGSRHPEPEDSRIQN
jgi:hypothetical protein